VTDDPEPVDYQHWEFYIASQHTQTSDDWSGRHDGRQRALINGSHPV
jgi:hypothetical protein